MKKSQQAMEFLMTYGWAIIVVLVAIGALAYFGVLNIKNLSPEPNCYRLGYEDQLIVNENLYYCFNDTMAQEDGNIYANLYRMEDRQLKLLEFNLTNICEKEACELECSAK